MYAGLAGFAILAFAYSLIAGKIQRLPLSAPIIFVGVGIAMSPLGLDWFSPQAAAVNGKPLIDVTLALILFIDAANANLGVLRRNLRLPVRMLVIGLPLTMAFGTLVAAAWFDVLSLYEAAVLGTMLAATDAALGKAVVTNPKVPDRLREGLSAESGLNDGLCVPFLLLFIALELGDTTQGDGLAWVLLSEEIGIGVAVGIGLTVIGAWLLKFAKKRKWLDGIWLQVSLPALAIGCFAIAQSLHGSGYIAAFVGGLVFRGMIGDKVHHLVEPAEGIGEVLALVAWVMFGLLIVPLALPAMNLHILLYALLSLTIIRMIPIGLSLAGSGERTASKLFLGWFGPRGLASLAFAAIVVSEQLPHTELIVSVVVCTVGISLVVHGISAKPLSERLAASEQTRGKP
jgi:NhaP-type Na+/H+ or K+/H+ antiporter